MASRTCWLAETSPGQTCELKFADMWAKSCYHIGLLLVLRLHSHILVKSVFINLCHKPLLTGHLWACSKKIHIFCKETNEAISYKKFSIELNVGALMQSMRRVYAVYAWAGLFVRSSNPGLVVRGTAAWWSGGWHAFYPQRDGPIGVTATKKAIRAHRPHRPHRPQSFYRLAYRQQIVLALLTAWLYHVCKLHVF